jgi:putative hemolysin
MRSAILSSTDTLPPEAAEETPVRFSYSRPEHRPWQRAVIRAIEMATGQPRLERLYEEFRATTAGSESLFAAAVRLMGIEVDFDRSALAAVPRQGPLLFLANHPFGVLDGIVLTWLAIQARPDTKILVHSLLCQPPEAKATLLPIDFGGTEEARATTVRSRLAAQRWLAQGHAVAIFPGGSVATSQNPFWGPALDPPWHPFAAKLIRGSRAAVVPVLFKGQNSRAFHIASHINYTLRLSLLFHETARRLGSRVEAAIGAPVLYEELESYNNRAQLMMELRRRTFELAHRFGPSANAFPDHRTEFQFPKHVNWD